MYIFPASKIRQSPLQYWNYLSPPVQRFSMMLIGIRGDSKYAEYLANDFNVKLVFPYPMKNMDNQQQKLSDKEYSIIIKSEVKAMYNFGYPFLFMVFDSQNMEYTENYDCKKVFDVNSEQEYKRAHDYCEMLLHATWQELFV